MRVVIEVREGKIEVISDNPDLVYTIVKRDGNHVDVSDIKSVDHYKTEVSRHYSDSDRVDRIVEEILKSYNW